MSDPRVVVRKEERKRVTVRPWTSDTVLRVVGWVGVVLAVAGLGDSLLAFYPLGFGSPEWEVGTVASVIQGLPLVSLGLAGVWIRAGGLGERRMLFGVGAMFWFLALILLVMLVLLLTDFPIALAGTRESEVARQGIVKLMAKTVFLGVLFGVAYVGAGLVAVRQARGERST